jgi:hypothetical protein
VGLKAWFEQFADWFATSPTALEAYRGKNNIGSQYDVQLVSYLLYTGQVEEARSRLEAVKQTRFAIQIAPDGSQPLELARTNSWDYSIYNMDFLLRLALLGDEVGVDLWNFQTADGRSLRKAIDFLVPYASGAKTWPYPQMGVMHRTKAFTAMKYAAVKYGDPAYERLAASLGGTSGSARENLYVQ